MVGLGAPDIRFGPQGDFEHLNAWKPLLTRSPCLWGRFWCPINTVNRLYPTRILFFKPERKISHQSLRSVTQDQSEFQTVRIATHIDGILVPVDVFLSRFRLYLKIRYRIYDQIGWCSRAVPGNPKERGPPCIRWNHDLKLHHLPGTDFRSASTYRRPLQLSWNQNRFTELWEKNWQNV